MIGRRQRGRGNLAPPSWWRWARWRWARAARSQGDGLILVELTSSEPLAHVSVFVANADSLTRCWEPPRPRWPTTQPLQLGIYVPNGISGPVDVIACGFDGKQQSGRVHAERSRVVHRQRAAGRRVGKRDDRPRARIVAGASARRCGAGGRGGSGGDGGSAGGSTGGSTSTGGTGGGAGTSGVGGTTGAGGTSGTGGSAAGTGGGAGAGGRGGTGGGAGTGGARGGVAGTGGAAAPAASRAPADAAALAEPAAASAEPAAPAAPRECGAARLPCPPSWGTTDVPLGGGRRRRKRRGRLRAGHAGLGEPLRRRTTGWGTPGPVDSRGSVRANLDRGRQERQLPGGLGHADRHVAPGDLVQHVDQRHRVVDAAHVAHHHQSRSARCWR